MTPGADNRKRWAQVVIHCALVLLVFVVPDLLITYVKPQRAETYYLGVYARTVSLLIVFYVNYLWLIPRTITRRPRRVWLFVCVNILLALIFLGVMYLIMRNLPHHHHRPRPEDLQPDRWRPLLKLLPIMVRDFLAIVLAIGLSVALKLTESWASLERRNEEILAAQHNEEIQHLRSQLNPHSIFNTLNTIYALIDVDTEQAKKAVHRLSKLLRYMLYENPSTVALSKEAEFISSYVELMEMRLGPGKVVLEIDLDGKDDAPVAPLLFLPVIENAFKHGVGVTSDKPIYISIKAGDAEIVCTAENPCAPSDADSAKGIGLENLRRRLRLLYGAEGSLTITRTPSSFTARITIPKM